MVHKSQFEKCQFSNYDQVSCWAQTTDVRNRTYEEATVAVSPIPSPRCNLYLESCVYYSLEILWKFYNNYTYPQTKYYLLLPIFELPTQWTHLHGLFWDSALHSRVTPMCEGALHSFLLRKSHILWLYHNLSPCWCISGFSRCWKHGCACLLGTRQGEDRQEGWLGSRGGYFMLLMCLLSK